MNPPRSSSKTAAHGAGDRRSPGIVSRLVGEEGFEPSHPFGHTDLNRARLPFRHSPEAVDRLARPQAAPCRLYDRMLVARGGTNGGSPAAV